MHETRPDPYDSSDFVSTFNSETKETRRATPQSNATQPSETKASASTPYNQLYKYLNVKAKLKIVRRSRKTASPTFELFI
jgi:hypothetical protein